MNYGMYVSGSAMLTHMARQDVFANNLANINTPAFKPDSISVRHRLDVRSEDGLTNWPSDSLIERLGAGVMPTPTRSSIGQAALQRTESALDLGIEGEGFFVVRAGSGPEGLRLTRDGRTAINAEGRLVTANEGYPLLDDAGREIRLAPNIPFEIQTDGLILQGGSRVARLGISTVPDPSGLRKEGAGLFGSARPGGALDLRDASGLVRQGHLEASGVNAIDAIMDVEGAAKAAAGQARIISYYDELSASAISRLGRVA